MKKLIVIILFALCSAAFAEPTKIDTVGNNSKVDPSDLQDEASLAALMALVGGAGTVYSLSASNEGSLEGGGGALLFITAPSICLLVGGLATLIEVAHRSGGGNVNVRETGEQQVKVDFVPLINPLAKTVGMDLALRF